MLPHVVVVEHGKSGAVKGVRDGEGMNLLGEAINDDKNCIVTIGEVKACDEVDGDVFPGDCGYRVGNKFAGRRNMRIFGSLATDVRLDISVNLGVHARPPVVAGDEFSGPPFAWMFGKRRVMVKRDDFGVKLQVF